MVVDDIVVVGAAPLFMTDYIACGKVVPERIAAIVDGIARACAATAHRARRRRDRRAPRPASRPTTTTSPARPSASSRRTGCSARTACGRATWCSRSPPPACTATATRWCDASCADAGLRLDTRIEDYGTTLGEALLEPTRLYTADLLDLLDGPHGGAVHALEPRHRRRARGEPRARAAEGRRGSTSTARPGRRHPCSRCSRELGGFPLADVEGAWNLGIGMFAVVDAASARRDRRRARGRGRAAPGRRASVDAAGDAAGRRRAGRQGCRRRNRPTRRRLRLLNPERALAETRAAPVRDRVERELSGAAQRCESSSAKSSSDQPACGLSRVGADLRLEGVVVRVRAEVLQIACDLRVLRLLTASPHA